MKSDPLGTQARLSLDLMLYTGCRRDDAWRLGRQHIKNGRLVYTPKKTEDTTGTRVDVPIHPNLAASIAATPVSNLAFLTKNNGKPWGARESFGNRFKEWCKEGGLPHCSAHGLRKAASVMLVHAGCSSAEATAVTGHDSIQIFEQYIRERDREALATKAMARWISAGKSVEIVPPEINITESETDCEAKFLSRKEKLEWMAPRTGLEPVTR